MTGTPDTAHAADIALFDDVLSCELPQPVAFIPGTTATRQTAAETTLRAIAQMEDLRAEESEERGELPQMVQRMDAKLDLMLALLARLVRRGDDALAPHFVRWSSLGIRIEGSRDPAPAVGTAGTLRLQPSDWLPELIDFPASVLATAAGNDGTTTLWLRFAPLGASLEEALEKHLFRLHRRQIADARRTREPDA